MTLRRAVAVASLAIVACGERGERSADTPPDTMVDVAADTAAVKACDLITEAELERIVGVDLRPARTTNDYAGDSQCRWDLPGDAQRGVSISLRENFGLVNYRVPGTEAISGIGDSAVWNPSAGQLAVQTGPRVISVGMLLDDPQRAQAESIARIALGRI